MKTLKEAIAEYKKQLEQGDIQVAYRGLMDYMMKLRTHLKAKYPDYFVSGSIYQGYMDMSYFSFTPQALRQKKLKIAIVFIHDKIRFEVWLVGVNKQIQKKILALDKGKGLEKISNPSKH